MYCGTNYCELILKSRAVVFAIAVAPFVGGFYCCIFAPDSASEIYMVKGGGAQSAVFFIASSLHRKQQKAGSWIQVVVAVTFRPKSFGGEWIWCRRSGRR